MQVFYNRCIRCVALGPGGLASGMRGMAGKLAQTDLRLAMGVDSVQVQLGLRQLRYLGHLARLPEDRLERRMLWACLWPGAEDTPPTCRLTWANQVTKLVKEAMGLQQLPWESWFEIAQACQCRRGKHAKACQWAVILKEWAAHKRKFADRTPIAIVSCWRHRRSSWHGNALHLDRTLPQLSRPNGDASGRTDQCSARTVIRRWGKMLCAIIGPSTAHGEATARWPLDGRRKSVLHHQ